ncbi:hypothetical protein [Roseateles sp. L2-2]|uniref:hypothetical protein n=1 Tax=Roseateles sp. L2-2 TaxID=3422597 RepID=UPI003D36DC38
MTTPLYPTFEKRIDDATTRIVTRQVEPWLFMNQGLAVQRHDGRTIAYSGVHFDGSPRMVFWGGYIEPFLQDLVLQELKEARTLAKEREVNGSEVLVEVKGLLTSALHRVFAKMADVDQRLRGGGYPSQVQLRPVEKELAQVQAFLDRHVQAELEMWKPRPSYEAWYDRNKFLIWAAGTFLTVVGLGMKFL